MTYINGLSSRFPKIMVTQDEVVNLGRKIFSKSFDNFEKILKVYKNSGVKNRFLVKELSWYQKKHNWKERNALFKTHSIKLLSKCISDSLQKSKIKPEQIGSIVLINSTGISTPTLDAELINLFKFKNNIRRLPIFGYGCAGGVLGLIRGSELQKITQNPVLVCNVEICSLTFRPQVLSKANIVSTALFGDGACSYILDSCGVCEVKKNVEFTWKNTEKLMGWNIEDDGLGVIFDKQIPTFINNNLPEVVKMFFDEKFNGYILHSGGMKIINAYQKIFKNHFSIEFSKNILENYGNVSSVSVLLVLEKLLKEKIYGKFLMSAMGPGFTAGLTEINIAESN